MNHRSDLSATIVKRKDKKRNFKRAKNKRLFSFTLKSDLGVTKVLPKSYDELIIYLFAP